MARLYEAHSKATNRVRRSLRERRKENKNWREKEKKTRKNYERKRERARDL